MYSHELFLEKCNKEWKKFFSLVQHQEEFKLELLFLTDETKLILENLTFVRATIGRYSQISHNDSRFFTGSNQKSGNMLCKSGKIDIHIDLTVESEKILFFDMYTEEEDEEEDWWNPKPILMDVEFPIIRHCLEEFNFFNYLEKAQETYLESVNSKR